MAAQAEDIRDLLIDDTPLTTAIPATAIVSPRFRGVPPSNGIAFSLVGGVPVVGMPVRSGSWQFTLYGTTEDTAMLNYELLRAVLVGDFTNPHGHADKLRGFNIDGVEEEQMAQQITDGDQIHDRGQAVMLGFFTITFIG